jgi:hypothetical protein
MYFTDSTRYGSVELQATSPYFLYYFQARLVSNEVRA